MARFVIWGSAGHAKVVAGLLRLQGSSVVALFDNNPSATSALKGVPLYIGKEGFERWRESEGRDGPYCAVVAIGGSRGTDRLSIQEFLKSSGLAVEVVIHPKADVCATARIGEGSQILAGTVISSDCVIGKACIVNHRASVDHECKIGDGVHIAPGATVCGCVALGNNVMIGAGSVVLPRIKIQENTVVGAGAVVTRDLPPNVVAVGNPARVVRPIAP